MIVNGYEVKPFADLRGADLSGAHLYGADLRGARLYGADLRGAHLYGAKDIPALVVASLNIPPTEGSFIAWKKAGRHIIKLEIPARAKRSSATGRKCRASYVKTLAIYPDGVKKAVSGRGGVYRVGRLTRCHKWDPDRWKECSGGIHFFMTREEAEAW